MDEFYSVPLFLQNLSAKVSVPGSKSITNRALPLAALANGRSVLKNPLFSDDSHYCMAALGQLGYQVQSAPDERSIVVEGRGTQPLNHLDGISLFVGNSGTTARFLSALVSLGQGIYRVDGVPRMRQRPMRDLLLGLRALGVQVSDELGTGCAPLVIEACGMRGGRAIISGRTSSQFLSGLLMAAPYARGPVEIEVADTLVSTPYVNMTVAMMAQFGVHVEVADRVYRVEPSVYLGQEYEIEPDASGASYFLAAAAICGGTVTIRGLGAQSLQGDAQFATVLGAMGCIVSYDLQAITVTGPADGLRGVTVDLFAMSDMLPTLAAIAPFAKSPTRIVNVANARVKETDRIAACATELRRFGVTVEEFEDGLEIQPCHCMASGVLVETYEDHRMAMAFSVLGLRVPHTVIENYKCVEKTFPDFYARLEDMLKQSTTEEK